MYFGGSSVIYQVFGEIKKGIQYVREIDSALTELKKVTDETEETYDKFLDTAAKTADKVGSTVKEIVSSTADWARLGYSMEEAAGLAESTSVLLNVSEFQSIEDATSALTSTLQAFGYTAEQSMDVVDVLNEVGNNFAISSDGIATALQDSASSLMAANNSYEEAVALIAAANRVVQDPNSVGAALRTISLRLRGTSVEELEESGEDTTGAIESKSKLRGKIKSLSGVDILTDTGAYKSTYEILLEISKVWEEMSDIDQAALLEILAGKTRSNTAAAILSNTEDLEEAYATAMDAEGSAYEENEKYLDSIQGRIDLFNNSVQTMWNNTLDSSVVKDVVDLGTHLIKIVDTLGLIPSILAVIGAAKGFKALFKGFSLSQIIQDINSLTMGTKMLNIETVKTTMGLASEASAFHLANSSLVQYAIKMKLATFADVEKMTTTQLLGLSFKALGTAIWGATKAIISFLFTNPVGWIMLLVGAIASGVAIFKHFSVSAEEASETLKETKDNISALESELESLQSQLDETREKIGELTALPSLSLTQQEDLDRLEREVELLERQIALKERQLAIEEAQLIEDAETDIEKKWSNKGDNFYAFDYKKGIIEDNFWYTGYGAEDALTEAISQYEKNSELIKNLEDVENPGKYQKQRLEELKEQNTTIAKSIEELFNDPDYVGLSYGMSDEIDAFLDEYNQAQLKWEKVLYGDNSKASAIQSLFGTNATEEMKTLKGEIDKIMAEDDDWDDKNDAIMKHLNNINETTDGYQQLKFVMDELDVSKQDIADYFTIQNGAFDSSTIAGVTAQYQKGIEVMEQFKSQEEQLIAVGNEYNKLVNGNVDYNKRPFVSPEEMQKVYPEFDGDIATTWDSDEVYGDGKGGVKYTLKFTPILEDGTVLDEKSY
ncbi:MAG: phage tail tape measure protein, partial [Bacteroidales bacterium]|nr:phage tail tape measure protein [Bacteroidales bacterium]